MSVRDEDCEVKSFHPVDLYRSAVDVPTWAERVINEQVDRSPQAWTARLVWEDLREAGHDGITEDMVAKVMS